VPVLDHIGLVSVAKGSELRYELEGEFYCHISNARRFVVRPMLFGSATIKSIRIAGVYNQLPVQSDQKYSNESYVPLPSHSVPSDIPVTATLTPTGEVGRVLLLDDGGERANEIPPYHRNDFIMFPGTAEFLKYLELLKERRDYLPQTPRPRVHGEGYRSRDRRRGRERRRARVRRRF
jgi:hypothetical protein